MIATGRTCFRPYLVVNGSDHTIEISMSRLPTAQHELRSRANLLAVFVIEPDETGPVTATLQIGGGGFRTQNRHVESGDLRRSDPDRRRHDHGRRVASDHRVRLRRLCVGRRKSLNQDDEAPCSGHSKRSCHVVLQVDSLQRF